jgi:hypothetical protein
MAQTVCVVNAVLPSVNGQTVDFVKEGFGTPSAVIFIAGEANTSANPAEHARISIGFWDGTQDYAAGIYSEDNLSTMAARRGGVPGSSVIMVIGTGSVRAKYDASAITDGVRLTMTEDVTVLNRYCTAIMISGVSAKSGSLQMSVTQDASVESGSLGFAPEMVFCLSIGVNVESDDNEINGVISFGVATASAHRMIAFGSSHSVADERANILFSTTRCVGLVSADTSLWNGEITTFGADTFTLTTRDGGSGSYVYFLALGGTDLDFDLGTLSTRTTTGSDQVATTINPDAVILALTTATGTSLETGSGANGFMVGVADDNGQFAHNISVSDGSGTSNSNSTAHLSQAIDLDSSVGTTRTDMINATVVFNTTNFELSYSTVDATARKGWWVAFSGQSLTYTQESYRWRYDDGDEDGATFSTYQDEGGSASIRTTKRLRVIVNVAGNPGSPAGKQFELQYRKAGSPTDEWKTVH